MKERRLGMLALLGAGLAAALLGVSAKAQQGAPPPAVLVQPAELKPIADQAEFIGRAAAVDKVELRARVKGFLGPRKFNDGDEVKEGQLLFTIEPEPYQAAVDQKVAQRDAAKAALAQHGFTVVGTYAPYPNATIIAVTNDEMKATAAKAMADCQNSLTRADKPLGLRCTTLR